MTKGILAFFLSLVVAGCSNQAGTAKPFTLSGYKQSANRGSYRILAEAFPQGPSAAGEWTFKTGLSLDKEELAKHKGLPVKLQYGVDSLFFLVQAKDTIWPSYVLPVATGQPLYPQFIVGFSPVPRGADSLLFQLRLAELRTPGDTGLLFSQQLLQRLYQ